ncbi:MAG: DUF177 domain-containing protein [Elusimicrobiota bacterium]
MKPIDTQIVIDNNGYSFSGDIDADSAVYRQAAESGAIVKAPLSTRFDISVGDGDFLLLGSLHGVMRLACARCLEAFESSFDQELEASYPKDAETIDPTEEFRQAIVLSVPEKPLCTPDCKGLCLTCGNNKTKNPCDCKV